MTDFIDTTEMTDRSAVVSCLLNSRLNGPGVSRVVLGGGKRPVKAPEVTAAAAQAATYAFASAAEGAGETSQKTKHNLMWAFRGLEPWRDPA